MKTILICCLLTCFSWISYSQDTTTSSRNDTAVKYLVVDEMPLFDGQRAEVGFTKHIISNLKYPLVAFEKGIEGTVYVQFTIDEEGKLANASIKQGVHELLDAEALRVVKLSPAWTPAKAKGQPVSVQYTFPIKFATYQKQKKRDKKSRK